jgi:hypothetical protein
MATSPQGKASRAEHAGLRRHALVEAVARIEGFVSVPRCVYKYVSSNRLLRSTCFLPCFGQHLLHRAAFLNC